MNKYDIECEEYGTRKAECYIGCFGRMLTILFRDLDDEDIEEVENIMEENYFKWCDDYGGMCCEEFIIQKLPQDFYVRIVAVIYENEDDEDEDY